MTPIVGEMWWVEIPHGPCHDGVVELFLAEVTAVTEKTVGLRWTPTTFAKTKSETEIGQFRIDQVGWVERHAERTPLKAIK